MPDPAPGADWIFSDAGHKWQSATFRTPSVSHGAWGLADPAAARWAQPFFGLKSLRCAGDPGFVVWEEVAACGEDVML